MDAMESVFMFPGQGSQQPGMAHDLWSKFDCAKTKFRLASEIFGEDLEQLCFQRPYRLPKRTDHVQILLAVVSITIHDLLVEEGVTPGAVLGHSAGEISALYASGVVDASEALQLATLRGRAMYEAAAARRGRMVAVRDIGKTELESVVVEHRRGRCLGIANCNAPTEFVVSGDADAVTAVEKALAVAGRARVVDLEQQGAWHSAHMEEAAARFAEGAEKVRWRSPSVPLLLNHSGRFVDDVAEIKSQVIRVIAGSVQWNRCLRRLAEDAPRVFCEVGPGRVLRGLLRKCYRELTDYEYDVYSVNDVESLTAFLESQAVCRADEGRGGRRAHHLACKLG